MERYSVSGQGQSWRGRHARRSALFVAPAHPSAISVAGEAVRSAPTLFGEAGRDGMYCGEVCL